MLASCTTSTMLSQKTILVMAICSSSSSLCHSSKSAAAQMVMRSAPRPTTHFILHKYTQQLKLASLLWLLFAPDAGTFMQQVPQVLCELWHHSKANRVQYVDIPAQLDRVTPVPCL